MNRHKLIWCSDGTGFLEPHHEPYSNLPKAFRPRHGGPERTRYSHPYSYDPFLACGHNGETNDGCYSDLMYEWDSAKARKCAEEHLKGVSEFKNLKKTQDYLRAYYDEPKLELIYVVQMCNASTGYPVWYFGYNTPKKEKTAP